MFYHIKYCLRPESAPLRPPCFTEHLQSPLRKVSGLQPATLLKRDTGVFLQIFQCNVICTTQANGCFCDVFCFFFSIFLFSQKKNSFLKSSSLKTGCTTCVISRGVLAAPISVLLWSFSSMLSKNHILSKEVMNVEHQMSMKNQIYCLMRSDWLFPTKPLPITWSLFLQQKNWFSGFSLSSNNN